MINLAILGTKGIPNRYGGFERFAEVLAKELNCSDFSIYVLKQTNKKEEKHTYNESTIIVPIYIPSFFHRNIQTLLYDLYSLRWATKNKIDVALECGHSFAPWMRFFGSQLRKKIVTNLDGVEHKREKWGFAGSTFLKHSEKQAVHYSARLISDNPKIKDYITSKYCKESIYIPYGAYPISYIPDENILKQYSIHKGDYYLMISRLTEENSIDLILQCFLKRNLKLIVIGDTSSRYANGLPKKYSKDSNIIFLGGIYDQSILDCLRYYSKAYIHGHSVGGTNPSLLEAMACRCFVVAHDNPFNRFVLNDSGFFFKDSNTLDEAIQRINEQKDYIEATRNQNYERIKETYCWKDVAEEYAKVFRSIVENSESINNYQISNNTVA